MPLLGRLKAWWRPSIRIGDEFKCHDIEPPDKRPGAMHISVAENAAGSQALFIVWCALDPKPGGIFKWEAGKWVGSSLYEQDTAFSYEVK